MAPTTAPACAAQDLHRHPPLMQLTVLLVFAAEDADEDADGVVDGPAWPARLGFFDNAPSPLPCLAWLQKPFHCMSLTHPGNWQHVVTYERPLWVCFGMLAMYVLLSWQAMLHTFGALGIIIWSLHWPRMWHVLAGVVCDEVANLDKHACGVLQKHV